MASIINKDKVAELVKKVSSSGCEVFGPVENGGVTLFRNLDGGIPSDFTNSKKPPKEVLFPQTETMFDFEIDGSKITALVEPVEAQTPILMLGVRPCDARAIQVLDALFTWDYIDPYYVNKRDRATIIGFSCTEPHMPLQSCFCTSVGGSPSSKDGLDMLWTDIGDRYLVESFTDKGNKILETGGNLFANAAKDDEKKTEDVKKLAESKIVRKLDTEGIEKALEATFDHEYWDEFARRCLGCGECTLLCPTCHCFDINDVITRGKGKRERTWDSCQYPYYTIHASGHNPRPDKKHRQRNRVYHKFLYSNKNLDMLGCVGCGRCISTCPVNIDIIEVVEGAKEAAK